jgi:FMN phosphatase YigB (HAD superfamily)
MTFPDVKILIWDFDGTLYKPNAELFHDVRESEYHAIMEHTGWNREKAIEEFHKLHKVTIQSATAVVAKLCSIPIAAAAVESEKYFDRRNYIHRDPRLIDMFERLKRFRHFILANGMIAKHKETLRVLGIPVDTFEEFVTAETVGVREFVDVAPAKKLGMHTCLVWSDTPSAIADVTLSIVYDVAKLLV